MIRRKLLQTIVGLILLVSFAVGCSAVTSTPGATYTPRPIPPTPTPTVTVEPTPPPPEHCIGVRVVDGVGEFYDRVTGERFVPRGNIYTRLAEQVSDSGHTMLWHSAFNPSHYNPALADEVLLRMHSDGYNIVRIGVNNCCRSDSLGDPVGGLSSVYISNIVDFLRRAKANDIFVLLETGDLPKFGGYIELMDLTSWSADFAGNSASLLRPGGILAYTKFLDDFIGELIHQGAPLDAILAYDLAGEFFYDGNLPPFSLTSGIVQTVNGKSYDMAVEEDKQRMMDEGLVYWINTLREEILRLDPTALVTLGFFWPQKPHPARMGDPRVIETRPAIWESSADFIDLHPYPGWELTLPQYVDNFGMAGMEEKPIIMGEFGAARSSYASEAGAARALHDWQVESCNYGFDGWLLWTWDTEEQVEFYNALTGQGLINQVLSPANRPDPCQAGTFDFFENNLALNMSAQASRSLPDQPPSGAVDGRPDMWWGAGDFAPQWIQIDLGKPSTINLIRMVVTQTPAGDTIHQVWVGATVETMYLLHTFEGYTVDGQRLEFKPDNPVENIRYIRVATDKSPSWVGWMEIEVLGS